MSFDVFAVLYQGQVSLYRLQVIVMSKTELKQSLTSDMSSRDSYIQCTNFFAKHPLHQAACVYEEAC